jgi:hypothetical protein
MIDWQALLKTLGETGLIVAGLAWLSKQIILSVFTKDLEKFKADLKSKGDLAIEKFKTEIQLEAQKRMVEYSSLHERRAGLIADLYSRLYQLYNSIQKVLFEYERRQIREDVNRKDPSFSKRQPWEKIPGIHFLDSDEQKQLKELSTLVSEFHNFYSTHKIYFTPQVCNLIDRFAGLAAYLKMNYENVALKDKDGNLYVNPEVKEVWDKAVEAIPLLLLNLEGEFRTILGVSVTGELGPGLEY